MPLEFQSFYFDASMVQGRVLDLFVPRNVTRPASIFFVHGGGWRGGTRVIFHPIIHALMAEGFVCGTTDYRLSGTNILDQIMDVRHGYHLFQEELRRVGRPERTVVFGSSAGAHLALLLALAGPGECGEELAWGDVDLGSAAWNPPAAAAVQSAPARFEPWDEIFPGSLSAMREIVGRPYEEAPQRYRRVSPMEYARASSPPALLMEAENEHMFPTEYNRQFVDKMRNAGARAEMIVYPRAEHGFFYDVRREVQKKAFGDLLKFIDSL